MWDRMNVAAKRADVVRVANAIITGEIVLIEGVRLIDDLRRHLEGGDEGAFLTILGVDSETEDFPLGATRALCAPEYLLRKDEERVRYVAEVRDKVISACEWIVETYSQPRATKRRR